MLKRMSKTKKNTVAHYELLYVISNQYTENEIKPIIEKISDLIKKNKGEITLIEEWGKKKLAYKIKTFAFGYYVLVEFDVEAINIKDIDHALRMSKEILRYMIVVKKKKTPQEIKEVQKRMEKRKEEDKKKEKAEKEKGTGEVNLSELDKKLDKILDTNDLI